MAKDEADLTVQEVNALKNDPPEGDNQRGADDLEASSITEDTTDEFNSTAWLLKQARAMWTISTNYMDSNITNVWETNLAHFHNQHAPGAPYNAKNFKRSNHFRPKTRSNMKAQEAKLAIALFSSQDMLVVDAEDTSDEVQVASAKINKRILQYRMEKRMQWELTVMGCYQDSKVYGICFSHQYWRYEVDTIIEPEFNDDGTPVMGKDDEGNDTPMGQKVRIVRHDDLCCDGIAPENMRFDPMADWRDPIGTSPYLVYMMPMYASDILEQMQRINPKTQKPVWIRHSLSAILATSRDTYNRTRQAREGRERVDPAAENTGNEFTTLWVHMNIQRVNGEDYMWFTMGTELVLSYAVRLREEYPWLREGERPFTMGFSSLEAHRNYPAGDVEQGNGLQIEINALANQRMDNVKLVLNKRYFVRRGSQTDLDALMRNVSGGGVMMNDPEKDVKVINTPDVTSSSYEEQDRLSAELDALIGSFDGSSVQANRNINETAEGMKLMSNSAGAVQDYGMTLFLLTWNSPTLYQLLRLVQMYETDETILALAAKEADIYQKFGAKGIDDNLLRQSLTVNVDVGIGNTDPVRRVEKMIYGVQKIIELPGMSARIKSPQIADEIFANLGYRTASRFFRDDAEQAEHVKQNPPRPDPELVLKEQELRIRREDNQMRDKRETDRTRLENEVKRSEAEQNRRDKGADSAARNNLEREKMQDTRQIEAGKMAKDRRSEILKAVAGAG